jgi:parallel beta-helix repeat protein
VLVLIILLVCPLLTFVYEARCISFNNTIYIQSDGSINPSTAPIQRNGNLYLFTDNILSYNEYTSGIVIERDNIVLNGEGYALQGNLSNTDGIVVSACANVTIQNLTVQAFDIGIYLASNSNYSSIFNSTITGNIDDGIIVTGYENSLLKNVVTNNGNGVFLRDASNNRLIANYINGNNAGIATQSLGNNTVAWNQITENKIGIECEPLGGSDTFYANNIALNQLGISQNGCRFYHNNITNNIQQVQINQSAGIWDDGYPSGGNYWSDYTGSDTKSGPYQNLTGSDGIGDTPYINGGAYDRYPLISPYTGNQYAVQPVTNFVFSPINPIAYQTTVVFNASCSTCINGTITNYLWNFGDGTYAEGVVTSHIYSSFGNYSVSLTTISNSRLFSNKSQSVYVRECPHASFQTLPSSQFIVGQTILFNASSSSKLVAISQRICGTLEMAITLRHPVQ